MASKSIQHKFKRNEDLVGATIDDELVMMSVEQGQYYGLSGIGPRVWELIAAPRTFDELVEQILEEFSVDRKVCEKDMVEFLDQMQELGLIQRD